MTQANLPKRPGGSLLRSAVVGVGATAIDLLVLSGLIYLLGVGPRIANAPALLAGAAVQFAGNRRFAFRASSGSIRRQAALFTAAEVVTLLLNGLVFDLLIVIGPADWAAWPIVARLIGQAAVFLGWSYPAWRWIFRPPVGPSRQSPAPAPGPSSAPEPARPPQRDDAKTTRRTRPLRSDSQPELIHGHR